MTRRVMTGRRTKISAMFTTAPFAAPDASTRVPGASRSWPDGDDLLAGLEAAGDDRLVTLGPRDLDVAQLDGHDPA